MSGTADTVLSGADAAWLRTFCTGFAHVAEHTSPDTDGASKSKTIKAVVDAYQAMADAATKAATDLEKLPEPAFPGHATVVPGVHDWFEAVASVYGAGATTIANGSYAMPSDLSNAIDQVESQMDAANNDLGTAIGEIDPGVSDAIVAAPECAALVGGN